MGKSRKCGLLGRQKRALKRLEEALKVFKANNKNKEPYDTTRNGKIIHHSGRKYECEVTRMQKEIESLKSKINKVPIKNK